MQGGTLAQALRPNGSSPMITWNSGGRNLALQVVSGLIHLHAHQVSSSPRGSSMFRLFHSPQTETSHGAAGPP